MRSSTHPGVEFFIDHAEPAGHDVKSISRLLGVSERDMRKIAEGRAPITRRIAHRIQEHFGVSPEYWYDRMMEYKKDGENRPS